MGIIVAIKGHEIFDSSGMPTLACSLTLDNGAVFYASVPAGTSTGEHEAFDMRDQDQTRCAGQGVQHAIKIMHNNIAPLLIGQQPDVTVIDKLLCQHDGTANKATFGANTILAVSMAVARAQAQQQVDGKLWKLIAQLADSKPAMPRCMFNMINGGLHANSGFLVQEFLLISAFGTPVTESLEQATAVHRRLGTILAHVGMSTAVGAEGGYAPLLSDRGLDKEKRALDTLSQAIELEGLTGKVGLGLDVAASAFYDSATKRYRVYGKEMDVQQLVQMHADLCKKFGLQTLEDVCAQDDWAGWTYAHEMLGKKALLIGDDLFCTNRTRIAQGVELKAAGGTIIKPNQIGCVSEAIDAACYAAGNGLQRVMSHRSRETNDDFIADFAVGLGAEFFKAGAPVRGERVAKYNRLLQIDIK